MKQALRKNKVARLSQRQKQNFRHVQFLCDFCAIFGGRKTHKTAARRLQGTHCVRTTDVKVRHPRICLTKAARLPQANHALYCKAAARMLRNVRLQLKIAQWPHSCRTGTVRRIAKCFATVLQILHDHLAIALHVTRDNLRLPYVLCEIVDAICLTVSMFYPLRQNPTNKRAVRLM